MGIESWPVESKNIFLSFAGEDEVTATKTRNFIDVSCEKQDIAIKIYFAPISNDAGKEWHNKILKEIKNSNVVIVLWTENSPKSMGQLIEVGAAWAFGKKIFAILDDVSNETLPKMVLSRVQSIPFGKISTLNLTSLFDVED